ncbi:hypothetical protein XM25_21255 [Devosia sp. H5989]|nr:hypothetical protein XM25_21255 [Devosia sp. H5989]
MCAAFFSMPLKALAEQHGDVTVCGISISTDFYRIVHHAVTSLAQCFDAPDERMQIYSELLVHIGCVDRLSQERGVPVTQIVCNLSEGRVGAMQQCHELN